MPKPWWTSAFQVAVEQSNHVGSPRGLQIQRFPPARNSPGLSPPSSNGPRGVTAITAVNCWSCVSRTANTVPAQGNCESSLGVAKWLGGRRNGDNIVTRGSLQTTISGLAPQIARSRLHHGYALTDERQD